MPKHQKEFIGRGTAKNLHTILLEVNAKRIFLVTGKTSFIGCGARDAILPLLSGYDVTIFTDYTANPTFEEARKGAQLFHDTNSDIIIAIGGGSVIDIAKAINAMQAYPGQEKSIACGETQIVNILSPFICIPTTAGTGSEATHFAVLYVDGKKYSIADDQLIPDVTILDAQFTDNLPPYISACTGFDALCQAIESYWSMAATAQSKAFATNAITTLVEELPRVINTGDVSARAKVLEAANWAGKAINISKTTAPHALSYTITSEFGLPHGHAVALSLGKFFKLHEHLSSDTVRVGVDQVSLKKIMADLYCLLQVNDASDATAKWYNMMEECGLETDLIKIGIVNDQNIERIINGVNIERLNNHPIKLTKKIMWTIFNKTS